MKVGPDGRLDTIGTLTGLFAWIFFMFGAGLMLHAGQLREGVSGWEVSAIVMVYIGATVCLIISGNYFSKSTYRRSWCMTDLVPNSVYKLIIQCAIDGKPFAVLVALGENMPMLVLLKEPFRTPGNLYECVINEHQGLITHTLRPYDIEDPEKAECRSTITQQPAS